MQNIVLLVGPTGSGKSSLAYSIWNRWPSTRLLRSFRTRAKRPSEEDDRLAAFVTRDEFRRLEQAGLLLHVERNGEDWYGLERCHASAGGQRWLSTMSPEGASELKRAMTLTIVHCHASPDVLRVRIRQRIERGDSSAFARLANLDEELSRFTAIDADYVVDTERTPDDCLQVLSRLFHNF